MVLAAEYTATCSARMDCSYLLIMLLLACHWCASLAGPVVVDGIDLTHFRTECKDVKCPSVECAFPLIDRNSQCCLTCSADDVGTPAKPTPSRPPIATDLPTFPPFPDPLACPVDSSNSTCPDTFCPVPIVRCDCCEVCKQDCRVTLCARPTCPNPVVPPGECCGRCETDCTLVDCFPLTCSEQVFQPGACCPSCSKDVSNTSPSVVAMAPACLDTFCPNPIRCPGGCNVCKQDCRVVSCVIPLCPNPIVAAGECCGTCKQDCRVVRCARPRCADPIYKPGECCPSCDGSACMLKGCVKYSQDSSEVESWQPDQCTTCRCSDDHKGIQCVGTPCHNVNCSRGTLRTVPGNCCPTCDYGTPDRKCGLVLQRVVYQGHHGIKLRNYTQHKCDKPFIMKRGNVYSCVPKYRYKTILVADNYRSTSSLAELFRYKDVARCKPVSWKNSCHAFFP